MLLVELALLRCQSRLLPCAVFFLAVQALACIFQGGLFLRQPLTHRCQARLVLVQLVPLMGDLLVKLRQSRLLMIEARSALVQLVDQMILLALPLLEPAHTLVQIGEQLDQLVGV